MLPNSKCNNTLPSSIDGCSEANFIANKLNEYFVGVGERLASQIPIGDINDMPEILGNGNTLRLSNVTLESVLKYLRGIKVSKATGSDGLNARLLKDGAGLIRDVLAGQKTLLGPVQK